MQPERQITQILFQGFVLEAAKKRAVFSPKSAAIILRYCEEGSKQIRRRAQGQFDLDTERAEWISDELFEIRSGQVPRVLLKMLTSAKREPSEAEGIVKIREDDTEPAFFRLCPGFWPFC